MIHFGDITKIKGANVPLVDIVTGGSPCQDLSVAGKRAGLAGERSGLFMEQIRVIKEMRENDRRNNGRTGVDIRPRFMVWENVPGAFSSNKGEDFRAVLEETAKVAEGDACIPRSPNSKWPHAGCIMGDGWSIAWRVHDAQFWGVPQRRKRIALVADFGGDTAPEILFERESVSGDIKESGKQGEGAAENAERCVDETSRAISFQERAGKPGGGKGILIQNERTGALSTLNNQSVCAFEPGAASRVGGHVYEDGKAGTVRANAGDNQQAVVYGISAYESNAMKSGNPNSGIYEAETARTLDLNGGSPACNQGGMAVVYLEGNGSRPSHRGDGYSESETMYTLNSTEHHAVAYRKQGYPQNAEQGQGWEQTEVNDTLNVFDNGESRTPTIVLDNHPQDSRFKIKEDGVFPTMSARQGAEGAPNTLMVLENHPNDSRVKISEDGMVQTLSGRMETGGGNVPMVMESINGDISGTLDASYYKGCGERQGVEREVVCVGNGQLAQARLSPTVGTLNCMHDQQAVMTYQEHTETVDACIGKGTSNQLANNDMFVANALVVRRLTPLECERLQGFPSGWTDIGDWVDSKGKKHKGESDSPRYKALGNSIALPFWEWMAKRMVAYLPENPTMASLFSGIGGFELVFSRAGCAPVWESEVEEFTIAVTKLHFGDDERAIKGLQETEL